MHTERANTRIDQCRRHFLRLAGPAAALGPFFLFRRGALAQQKTLKIARWPHFLPEFDEWFEGEYVRDWGRQHDTRVIVDLIPIDKVNARAATEAAGGKGHDLFMFPWPPAEFQQYAIDHSEVYQEVGRRHGTVNRIGHKSTFNPVTKKYFAFADSWMPFAPHYFEDYWGEVGLPSGPVHYNDLRSSGKDLRAKLGIPVGLALSPTLEGNITLHTLLYAFHSAPLDADGNVLIYKSYGTITALKYVKALFDEAGTPDALKWGDAGNARAMLERKTSFTLNAMSVLRTAEEHNPEVAKKMQLSPPLLGPAGIISPPHVTSCSLIWNFAENKEGAKQFLADLVDDFKTVYEKSRGCNFPIYQNTVPDLIRRLEKDTKADPPLKYTRLKDALHWTPNLGFPGFATPAAMEVFNTFVIPRMFSSVVKGQLTAEQAAQAAESEVKRIAEKWKRA